MTSSISSESCEVSNCYYLNEFIETLLSNIWCLLLLPLLFIFSESKIFIFIIIKIIYINHVLNKLDAKEFYLSSDLFTPISGSPPPLSFSLGPPPLYFSCTGDEDGDTPSILLTEN
jgi:hypothetical protein